MSEYLKKIKFKEVKFPEEQYFNEVHNKTQIVLHDTVSGRGTNGDFRHWLTTPQRIATCIIVDWKGVAYQCFSSKYYAYHLGIKGRLFKKFDLPYQNLNKSSIGIEIDAWGQLLLIGSKFYNWFGKEVDKDRVTVYEKPYRTYMSGNFFEKNCMLGEPCHFYERYTEEQIETVKNLMHHFRVRYGIHLGYNEDMWDLSKNALSGKGGIWAHTSFRESGKADCHPQTELIDMLKSLTL